MTACPHCGGKLRDWKVYARQTRKARGECIDCGHPLTIGERERGNIRCLEHRKINAARMARLRRNVVDPTTDSVTEPSRTQ